MSDISQNIRDDRYKNTIAYSKATNTEWRAEERRLVAVFWSDVEEEYREDEYSDIQWKTLTEMAWDHGHSYGYHEVLSWVEDLKQLLDA